MSAKGCVRDSGLKAQDLGNHHIGLLQAIVMAVLFIVLLWSGILPAIADLAQNTKSGVSPQVPGLFFFSEAGREYPVEFSHVYRVNENDLQGVKTQEHRERFIRSRISPTLDFIFGPLVYRSLGGPQRGRQIEVDWEQARPAGDGMMDVPYRYRGTWILHRLAASQGVLEVPVPLNKESLYTLNWKACTDRDPEHQTASFFWYFWDPSRYGCDHVLGRHYAMVPAQLGTPTLNQKRSLPEYARLIEDGELQMTLAFGYVADALEPKPDADTNSGASEYRKYLQLFRARWGSSFKETPIQRGDYSGAAGSSVVIGRRFEGNLNGLPVTVKVVMAAGVDQMELFAKSFAHDHDDFFGWYGHSRVGSGFDAERFGYMLRLNPDFYSISEKYQIVHWGGCNSYSYYTLPFFDFKAQVDGVIDDPYGTRNLDIIANGLPSYFSFNANAAMIVTKALLNWPEKTTYQTIVRDIERLAQTSGARVLAVVLGDEDNVEE